MSKIRLHGSSSGYTEIAPVAASGNNTLTLPNDGTIISKDAAGAVGVTSVVTTTATITTAKVGAAVTISESGIEASGIGITVANINGGSIGGRRNLAINGAMNVAQRGTSRSATSQGNGFATVDRFVYQWNHFSVTATENQSDLSSSDTPYTLGFRKYHRMTLASAGTAAVNSYIEHRYKFEAQDLATSGWEYTNPNSFLTFSFWFRCSTNQTFYTTLRTRDGTERGYTFSFTATGNNEWTKIVHSIPGNSGITMNNDNGEGLVYYMIPYYGTNYTTSSHTLNSWGTFSSSSYCPDMASTWLTAGASTFDVTGVQFEVGSQATAFEHRSFGEELSLCQRYYFQDTTTIAGIFIPDSADTDSAYGGLSFPVPMRAAPTVVFGDNAGNNAGVVTQHGAAHGIAATAADISINRIGKCAKSSGNWTTSASHPIAAKIASATAEL